MGEAFIVRKGGVAEEVLRTTAPTINFVSKTDSEIVVTFTNNDAAEAQIYYGLTSPLTDTVTLATTVTSSNITFSGLNDDTTFTVSAYALVTDPTSKKIKSEIVTTNITTDVGFDPSDLSPQLWLDAADASTITASSGSVSQWNNKGSLSNFTQGTSASQPTTGVSTLNGLNVIDFDFDFLTATNQNEWKFMHDGTVYELFAVITLESTGNFNVLIGTSDISSSTNGFDSSLNSSGNLSYAVRLAGTSNPNPAGNGTSWTTGAFAILSVFTDPTNSTTADRSEIRTNGGSLQKNNTSTGTPSTANPSHALQIGSGGTGRFPLNGAIAEMIVISGSTATSNNRTTVINYLADKWGITL